MTIKPGAKLCGLKPEILVGLAVAASVYAKFGYELRLTEGTGAKHMAGSLHYQGQGVDVGLPPDGQRDTVARALREALGPEFDLAEELDHWHIEWQPK